MRILVVEDEKRIADFLCRGLEGAGYAVDAALTGNAAIECIPFDENRFLSVHIELLVKLVIPLLEHMVETGDLGTRLRQGMIDSTLMRRPGTPEEVARCRRSHTGQVLRPLLNGRLGRNGHPRDGDPIA